MRQISHPRSRLWQTVSICLTVVGILLFIYGSRIAASQTDDKKYVEGVKRQQLVGSSELSILLAGRASAPNNLGAASTILDHAVADNPTDEPKPDHAVKPAADKDDRAAQPPINRGQMAKPDKAGKKARD